MQESTTIEFKEHLNRSVIKEIIAFANTDGGKIYIGISDDGSVKGIPDTKAIQERLSSMIHDSIKPSILSYINLQTELRNNQEIVRIDVQRGDGRPYYLADKGMKPSGVFKRLGNTSVPVSESDIREMIATYHGITYESTRSLNQSLTFNYTGEQFSLRQMPFGQQQMKTLSFIDEDGLYNNLALLFSDQCPHIIKAAIFSGDDKTDFRHRQEFGGSLLKQMDDVYQFLEMQNHLLTDYQGLRRIDHYDYSPIALREGLMNAIIHREYGLGGSIFVNVYRSSCEFVSLGSLPKGIYLEDIYEGVSKPRNEKLAQVFYRLKLIEAYGTGIMKIMSAYKHVHVQPEIKVTPGAFILRLPVLNQPTEPSAVMEPEGRYHYSSQAPASNINLKDGRAVDQDILSYVKDNGSITRRQLQERYNFSQTKSGTILRKLEEQKLLSRHGQGRNIYYSLPDK